MRTAITLLISCGINRVSAETSSLDTRRKLHVIPGFIPGTHREANRTRGNFGKIKQHRAFGGLGPGNESRDDSSAGLTVPPAFDRGRRG